MKDRTKLIAIKLTHTAVWLVMAAACLYILYAGIFNITSIWLWICISLIALESLVLLINKWTCPLTDVALRYTEAKGDNFDIYLPNLIAKYNKLIFGSIFATGLILVIINNLF